MSSPAITRLTEQFIRDIQEMVIGAIGVQGVVHGTLPAAEHFNCRSVVVPIKTRRKAPIQLCPAPRCKGRAAPIYGMLCGKHKGTAKKTVESWRAARRDRKARA